MKLVSSTKKKGRKGNEVSIPGDEPMDGSRHSSSKPFRLGPVNFGGLI